MQEFKAEQRLEAVDPAPVVSYAKPNRLRKQVSSSPNMRAIFRTWPNAISEASPSRPGPFGSPMKTFPLNRIQ